MIPNVKSNHPEKTSHPCQFPVELVERLVLSMTNKSDKVFDPYLGVGSSGCDIKEDYIAIASERIDSLEAGTLKVRPMGKPIFGPSLPSGGH